MLASKVDITWSHTTSVLPTSDARARIPAEEVPLVLCVACGAASQGSLVVYPGHMAKASQLSSLGFGVLTCKK